MVKKVIQKIRDFSKISIEKRHLKIFVMMTKVLSFQSPTFF